MADKKYKPDTVRAAFSKYAVGDENDGEQRMFCPICESPDSSKSPSASMNADSGVWNCLKGNHGGSIAWLVRDLTNERGFNIRAEAMRGRHLDQTFRSAAVTRLNSGSPLPDPAQISKWTEALMGNKKVLGLMMETRGLDRRTIIEWELGWDGSRYTIPVRDIGGELLNVRRYKLNAGVTDKMLNLPGHGTAQIYRPDILASNEEIVITEGEMDCIILNQYGIPAVTHTAGAATFRPNWAGMFIGKTVWVAYDNDDAGRKGSKKVEQILTAFAERVYIMEIPIPVKGADVTDFLHKEGHSASDFRALMQVAQESASTGSLKSAPLAEAGERFNLQSSMSQANQAKTMELIVSISGKQAEPYTAPKRITATCDMSKGAACEMCPIAARNGQAEIDVREDDDQILRFVDVTEQRHKQLLRDITGARCSDRVEFEVDENYHIEELLVQPSVDDRQDGETQQPIRRTAFSVSTHASTVNSKVRLVGKNVSDPKSGRLRWMSWVNQPVELDIDKFTLTPGLRERLETFQPVGGQSPLDKALEIANDMASNVTHIYGRDLLHVGYDLVWHSPVSFKIHDMTIPKGWLEMLVVGDTRTGKSEAATRLAKHYRSGIVQSCEGMSFPGLVGGVQQVDGRWHMTWGVIPMNDRRLVVLDEVSGLKEKNVIEQMSSIRSSGIAQVTKIAAEETSARTRLVWIANPADGSMIRDSPTAGMGAMRTVVEHAEDIARFDFVMATAKGDVDTRLINASFSEVHNPSYSSEDCEALAKWAWSLTRDDVVISDAAADAAVKAAINLGERYMSDPPLIQSENARFKVLRVAAALAARTFSVSKRGKLQVGREHVHDAVRFLDMIYGESAMGYATASGRYLENERRAVSKKEQARAYLREHQDDILLTLRMVGGNNFRTRDFADFGGMDIADAKQVVHTLLKWQLVYTKTRGDIGMSPILQDVIRELEMDE